MGSAEKSGQSIAGLAYHLAMLVLQGSMYEDDHKAREVVDNILAATDYGRLT
jgi:hypothetical protein